MDDREDEHELIRADAPEASPGAESLARVIDQSNREAAASRAQARELIKALEGVQRSQEYLGEALREERGKSRVLLALLVVAPIVAAAGVWFVWKHVETLKSDVDDRLARLDADGKSAVAAVRDARSAELAAQIETMRRDLDASREELAAERRQLADREAVLAAAQGRGDSARTEIGVLDFEVKSAKAKAGSEAARADILENRIRELQAELASRTKTPEHPATAPPAASPFAADSPPPVPVQAKPAASAPVETSKPAAGDAAAGEKSRTVLNSLLKDSGDTVRYEFTLLGAVSGRTLNDVVVVGTDDQGGVVRTIQASRAEIALDAASQCVVVRFFDGKLLIGGKQAPFFDGTYGLVVRGDAAKWKAAALSFVKDAP